jgi:hypothetical protein
MEITFEAPISAEDVELAEDRQSVALRREKFGALVEYVEHLEAALKGTEFEFRQERHFAGFLLEALITSLRMMDDVGYGGLCRDLAQKWGDEAMHLYREGSVTLYSADAFIRRLAEMTKSDAFIRLLAEMTKSENAEGAGHGQ